MTSVSTAALSQSLRYSLLRAQSDLMKAQKELQTGVLADTGLALGARTAQTVSFTRDFERMQGIVDSNTLISSRLKSSQDSLTQIHEAAQSFLSTLTTSSSGDAVGDVTRSAAKIMLEQLTSVLNTSFNGEHIFAGTNTDVTPIDDFSAPGSPAKAAFDAAFQAHFGFAKTDAAAASITAAQMDAFLTAAVEPQFLGVGWIANWSSATDQRIVSRVTLTDTTETSVSANDPGLRKLAMAAATISDLFDSEIGAGARQALLEKAVSLVGEAVGNIADLQATTGILQKRVSDASDRLEVQIDLFERQIGDMTGVDPYEAKTRVDALLGQIEASYALTARLQQLSILRFIS
ncbi:flagellar hook-associated family protein [Mesorhizobium sp. LHD-90]|uniref:flagellar hook-associated family protein n=1 Tax=Mesorhizobium sp. LHD-90 TaxID=3071414 RepID=UPI0027DEFBBE|nr:flagellar hook-associated family protein [Mesorhizobium sp. LHD-90]MDQ6433717.1 flagellar hook-associated family protein [Mesorhizobium sp. LHD-90]